MNLIRKIKGRTIARLKSVMHMWTIATTFGEMLTPVQLELRKNAVIQALHLRMERERKAKAERLAREQDGKDKENNE